MRTVADVAFVKRTLVVGPAPLWSVASSAQAWTGSSFERPTAGVGAGVAVAAASDGVAVGTSVAGGGVVGAGPDVIVDALVGVEAARIDPVRSGAVVDAAAVDVGAAWASDVAVGVSAGDDGSAD